MYHSYIKDELYFNASHRSSHRKLSGNIQSPYADGSVSNIMNMQMNHHVFRAGAMLNMAVPLECSHTLILRCLCYFYHIIMLHHFRFVFSYNISLHNILMLHHFRFVFSYDISLHNILMNYQLCDVFIFISLSICHFRYVIYPPKLCVHHSLMYSHEFLGVFVCLFVCLSLTSLCHSNGHIETMPAREINPFTALTRIRSQFLRTQ